MTNITEGSRRFDGALRNAAWSGALLLWVLPFVAMQFSDEVDWAGEDFVVWGIMLLSACVAFGVILRRSDGWPYLAGGTVAIGSAFLLIWVNLAVGIIGSESNPANLIYVGVLAIGVAGTLLARLGAQGMAYTMAALTAAQLVAGAVPLVIGWGAEEEFWLPVIILANGFFAALWLISAVLFWRAADAPS